MRRLDPVHFSMLVIGVSFACYAPSLDSLQDQAYRSAVVIEGEVSSLPENVSVEPYSVNVKVLDVWPVNSGGLEREQLVTVGEFGSEAPCVAVEKHHRYIFFMDPTEEPLVFKASFAPLDSTEKTLKKDVESILCEDCASAPKVKPMDSQWLLEGKKLTLKCEAVGNPSPSFNWYKDGSQLHKRKDVKIKSNKKNSKLHISRVRLVDSGSYTCVVENSLGRENTTSYVSIQSITTTLSPGSSHARKCNETEKTYCVNGGDCYFIHGINQLSCKCPNDYTGERCQTSVMAGFYKHLGIEIMEAEELYQKRVLTITGICVALLVVGIVCVVAYCKTKKQRKKMHNHLHQNMCAEHPNRMLANGPNHPGPGPSPEEIPMVDYISKNVPATERVVRHGTETSGNFSGSRMSSQSHHTSTASHASSHRPEERTWSMERTDSMHSDCQSGALSSSVGTSKCSSPACMEARARRAAYCGYPDATQCPLQYGDSYDSLRDSPHSDRYVSALTTPARLSPVEFHSSLPPQVPTFQITTPNASHALSLPPAASAIAMAAYSPDDDLPLLHHYRRSRRPYYAAESTGSLPSSPYRFVDDEDYETTQEYMSSREQPKKSSSGRRWRRRSRVNGHVSQRTPGPRDYSSQSCLSDSEWEDDEVGDLGHGESTPFLSMHNMNAIEPATIYQPNDTWTFSNTGCSGSRGNVQANKLLQSRSRPDKPL
ncbi:pro-neuregulin-2, membrane-bound isoform-like isoform X1 [Carassius carassius]|uniref:pro-neuregulin-2, membrane-bound isoform-like isoform X1 n=2 Tax=Carassius carassius TaxID=217509 RepID=UPI002868580E|nr:pro-neuregulin-2, membrane-bound isoform-like isoform X1 [Carassius carassius]